MWQELLLPSDNGDFNRLRQELKDLEDDVDIWYDRYQAAQGKAARQQIIDVELGIRGHKQGYQNIYLPTVRLYHLESKTRSPHVPAVDFEQSSLKYAPYRLQGDPFFNSNLDPLCSSPTPRFPVDVAA